ncbi:MAG: aspartate 1-decarboxylase [Flavobacteriaceae bacterium]|nr:aspartate 1-decarboxylase [Flavobacteriaceae bacterium]
MLVEVLKSKIHRVRLTDTNLNYIGSISLDENLMEAAGLVDGEKVHVLNVNNGNRLETYVIRSQTPGEVALHGPASRWAEKGDVLIIVSYAQMDIDKARSFLPRIIYPDEKTNQLSNSQN